MTETGSKISGELSISQELIKQAKQEIQNLAGFQKKIQAAFQAPVTELLSLVLLGAIQLEASDIHLEPEEEKVKLRIRVDGVLQDVLFLDWQIYPGLLSRIKLLAGLKLNISDRSQDGRFSLELEKRLIEIRVSSLPAEYGEAIVMRILDPKKLISLEDLGLDREQLKLLEKEIKRPYGLIIVTGPTGSGKTTTLYAFLRKIQKPEIKIITIEDPIEYHLEGVSQTQANPQKGYDFAQGLKAIMRQDPDVILVGESRDLETVNTALQASLTGHLVLTTLHTNDAAGAIIRLTALGAKVSNIGPALNVIVGQRLMRKVCPKCSQKRPLTTKEIGRIKKELAPLKTLKTKGLLLNEKTLVEKPKGCVKCSFSGYQGRIGIFEVLIVDDELEKFILKNPSIVELKALAIEKGMMTLGQDAVLKMLAGVTSLEELERVIGE